MRLERDEQQLLYHDRFRASGNGNGTVNFTVAPNTTGVARVGTLTVAGRNVTITQDAGPIANNDTATTDEDTPLTSTCLLTIRILTATH